MGSKVPRVGFALLIAIAARLAVAAQPAPAPVWRAVAAGVEHSEIVRTTDASGASAGPWSIHLLRIDLSEARLDAVHAMDAAVGLETVSSIVQRLGAIAAVNGGYFRTTGTFRGDSTGTLQIDGTLVSEPDRSRAAVGFVRDGKTTRLVYGHVKWNAFVDVAGHSQRLDGLNRPRGDNEVVVFTRSFHRTTLTDPNGTEVIVRGGRVTEIRERAGSTLIPHDGFVVSATGSAQAWARDMLHPGVQVVLRVALEPADPASDNPWAQAEDVVGAGPKLITRGLADITFEREKMLATFSTDRHPRTAIATLADGRALLMVVDGRQVSSIGMTLPELAALLLELGAVEAMNLDGGGSTTMVVQGKVVNHPSDLSGERPVSDAILVMPR